MPYADERAKCLEVAYALLHHKGSCHYSMGPNRWEWHAFAVPTFPFYGDCSSTFTAIDWWAGCGDPNGVDFGYGDTATMLHHAQVSRLVQARSKMLAADGCFFGWDEKIGGPEHVAMALQDGTHKDPLFFNMGSSADPSVQPLSVLLGIGAPIFFRNVTRSRNPVPPKPFPRPVKST